MKTPALKIAIDPPADEALTRALVRVNENFQAGRVSKSALTSFLIQRGVEQLTDTEIEDLRKKYFNQVAYLSALLKEMKASGRDTLDPKELSILQSTLGEGTPKRKLRSPYASWLRCLVN